MNRGVDVTISTGRPKGSELNGYTGDFTSEACQSPILLDPSQFAESDDDEDDECRHGFVRGYN